MQEEIFTRKLDLYRRETLVKSYIWSAALFSAETWTLRNLHKNYLENF
jgi:hypothetical protein